MIDRTTPYLFPDCPEGPVKKDTLDFSTEETVSGMVGSRLQQHGHILSDWLLLLFQLF